MTMLSAQSLTLTGEQHDRLWSEARHLREIVESSKDDRGRLMAVSAASVMRSADRIERVLIDAQDSTPAAQQGRAEA